MEVLNAFNHFESMNSQMFYQPTYDFNNYGHYENRSSQQLKRKHDFMDVVADSEKPSFEVQKKPFRTKIEDITLPSKINEVDDEDNNKKKNEQLQNQIIPLVQPTLFVDKDLLGNLVLSSTIYQISPMGKELIPVHVSKPPTLTPNGRFSALTSDRQRVTIEDSEEGPRIVEIKEEEEDDEPRIVEITDEEEKEINEQRSRKRREPLSPTPIDTEITSAEDAMDLD